MQPQHVFTPRSYQVNSDMYIPRLELEKAFKRVILGSKHVALHGESGTGKSWLYKKIFAEKSIEYVTINMARVVTENTISNVIGLVANQYTGAEMVGYSETKSAKIDAVITGGELANTRDYVAPKKDNLHRLLSSFRSKIGKSKMGYIVFENLEAIVHDELLLRELCNLILLADDEDYAKYNLGVLMVGTPSELMELITRCDNSNTVKNRISELPEVAVLSKSGVEKFINKGFFRLLKYKVSEESNFNTTDFINDIRISCDCVPQHLHELCLEIALAAEENDGVITQTKFLEGKMNWVRTSLISELSTIKSNLNKRATKLRRRDQVLYTLAHIRKFSFTPKEVELGLRGHFPEATSGLALNVAQILADLASTNNPVIRQNRYGSSYRFVSPKLKIVIHSVLSYVDGGVVVNDAVFGEVR